MVRSLWTAATGMIAQQNNVDTIANNLANVNTTGYKTETNEFKSLLYQTLQTKTTTANAEQKPIGAQVGLGVRNASITSQFSNGALLESESTTSFAVQGKGFFAVRGNDGQTYYTRNGDFNFMLNAQGGLTLANSDGLPVLNTNGQPITLNGDYLPYFFELGLLGCNPYPISVIAPGCEVRDDGEGVYLTGPFNAALLESTLNGANGYRINPSVVSGPYRLVSFDGTTAELERNDYFKGNADLELPLIEKLTYTLADNDDMEAKLVSGEFDILNKVTKAEVITAGMGEIAGGEIAMSNYPRSGLAYVVFCCEKDTVSSEAVRQAITWCMDRDAVMRDYTGNFGLRVDSYFGVGQWMYSLVNGTAAPPVDPPEDENDAEAVAEYEAALEAWAELSLDGLNSYTAVTEEEAEELAAAREAAAAEAAAEGKAVPQRPAIITDALAEAVRLLEEDGWTLNANGLREKDGVVLDLTMLVPAGNTIAESFEANWIPKLAEAGIRLTLKTVAPAQISATAYADGDREADMFFMATNFDIMFDPATTFEVGGERSITRQSDEELYELAVAMRETEPGEVLEYVQKWIAFEEKFNEALPMIPIYSNVYFDFYTSLMQNYDIAENTTWGEAILGAAKAEIPEYEVEEAEEAEVIDAEIVEKPKSDNPALVLKGTDNVVLGEWFRKIIQKLENRGDELNKKNFTRISKLWVHDKQYPDFNEETCKELLEYVKEA